MKNLLKSSVFAMFLLSGCSIGGYIDMDEIKASGKFVTVEDSFTTVLGFGYDSELTSSVRKQLLKKCGGKVTGVTTRFDITTYIVATSYSLKAQGLCDK